jgi:hypothetical protein
MRRSRVATSSVVAIAVASALALPPLWIWPTSEAAASTCIARPESGIWSGTWSSTKLASEHGSFSASFRIVKRGPYRAFGTLTDVEVAPVFASFTTETQGTVSCTGGWSLPLNTPVGLVSYTGTETGVATVSGTFSAPAINDAGVWSGVVVPVVTKIAPAHGPTTGGTKVKVKGSGFEDGTVDFGSHPAAIVNVSPNFKTITVLSPPGSGTVHVTVTTPTGTSAQSLADQFTYR